MLLVFLNAPFVGRSNHRQQRRRNIPSRYHQFRVTATTPPHFNLCVVLLRLQHCQQCSTESNLLSQTSKMIRWTRRIVTSPGGRFVVDRLASRSLARSFTASGLIRAVVDEGDKAPVYSLSDFPVAVDELTVNTIATSEAVVNVATHELTWRPPDMVMWLIDNIHVVYDLPYWESIVVTTLGLRFLMLPLAIKTVQNASRMAVLRPHMQRTQEEFLKHPRYEDMDTKLKYQNDIKALFKEHKVNPFRSLLMPLAQIPVFLSFFLGLREMSHHFPDMTTVCILQIPNSLPFLV